MKIAIATSGRFHLLDLARELHALGHDVDFYSVLPASRCEAFGLSRRCVRGVFWLNSGLELICRRLPLPRGWVQRIRAANDVLLDWSVSFQMRRCDVFIAISGVYVRALKTARRRYGATVLLERGCKHILEQEAILRAIPGSKHPSRQDIRRELAGYRLADYVVIASDHVRRSFLKHGFPEEKLFQDPYGTSLSRFGPTPKPGPEAWDVIMTGQWSLRKGCDLLSEACLEILGVRLLHVGAVVDCPLPDSPLFTHIDAVDELQLKGYYSQAKVFALASREEGLALVQAQAIACGLPVVCTRDTGGIDLAHQLGEEQWIIEAPETTARCLGDCIRRALDLSATQPEGVVRDYAGAAINELTWEAYGRRYDKFLQPLKK